MRPFAYASATNPQDAMQRVMSVPGAAFIAGGTNLVDLMIDTVATPSLVVDINALPLRAVDVSPSMLRIGATARMSDVADDSRVSTSVPMISEALNASASAQLRNAASIGGNVLQRTRCAYFRDVSQPCNKRSPGSGCGAIGGENRMHAILGGSDHCIATHASDLAVALSASGALVRVSGVRGERTIPIVNFYLEPGDRPDVEHVLERGELITSIDVPLAPALRRSTYLKVRDRFSYEFALVSAAVAIEIDAGLVRNARFAIGGVGTVPWRSADAEAALAGKPAVRASFEAAADIALRGAIGRGQNDFKIALARRTVALALMKVSA